MLSITFAVGIPALLLHMGVVCFSRALRTYSRSRLEKLCAARGRSRRASEVALLDERTDRAAEAIATVTGLTLAALLGATTSRMVPGLEAELIVAVAVAVAALGHIVAAVLGRVHAEVVIDRGWPLAGLLRQVAFPLTWLARTIEVFAYRRSAAARAAAPRPASVEVEVHSADASEEDALEAELPATTRAILERAVELARGDIRPLITARSEMRLLPASASLAEAARVFVETGFSRVPLFGENRDDIVGILHVKDLLRLILETPEDNSVTLRKLARPALFVPDSKNATELLEELRSRNLHMAIVLDEYGTVTGLITLEDLLEELVGPIQDEHDLRPLLQPFVQLGETQYEVDATVPIDELNERLGLHLPTHEDYETIGGLAFSTIGHVPQPGTSFRLNGVELTVLSVKGHAIGRLRIDLHPENDPGVVPGPSGPHPRP